jgi:glycosyltransferase involved in cell wall biosynthesis
MAAMVHGRRLLFLAPVIPSDRGNGLAMRTGFFVDAYSRAFDIDLAILPIAGPPGPITDFIRRRVRHVKIFPVQERDHGRPSLTGMLTPGARRGLQAWIDPAGYEVVHLSRLYLAEAITRWTEDQDSRASLVLDCDEDDVRTYRRIAATERRRGNDRVADWAQAEAVGFESIARKWLPFFALVFAASRNEVRSLARYRGDGALAVIPNAAPAVSRRRTTRAHSSAKTILFVGTMGYAPNRDGILWFTSCIWPHLRRALWCPARLVIVGQQPPPDVIHLGRRSDIIVTGWVPAVEPFYEIADLAIVPLRTGGGTRIKVLESAAFGVPVVSTTLGAEGLAFRRGLEVMIADSPTAFCRACVRLLTDKGLAMDLASRARRRVRWDYDARTWAEKLIRLVVSRARVTDQKAATAQPAVTGKTMPAIVSRAKDLEIKEVSDGYIVYQRSLDRVHYLNKTAAIVFEVCDSEHTVDGVVALVARIFDLDPSTHSEIRTCLEKMLDEGLLQLDSK